MAFRILLILIGSLNLLFPKHILGQESTFNSEDQLYFQSFTAADGLPSQTTFNTYQDKYGFLWISTSEGVSRYDGYEFIPYYDGISTGVRLKGACGFYEDEADQLWVISGSSYLHRYDRKRDQFILVPTPLQDGWMMPSAHSIVPDMNGNLWLSSHGGVIYYDRKQDTLGVKEISAIRSPEDWPHEEKVRFGPMFLQENKALWLGTIKFGLVKYDIQKDSTTFYRFDKEYRNILLDDRISDIISLDASTLLIADYVSGLVLWDLSSESPKDVINLQDIIDTDREVSVTDIHRVDKEHFWLSTEETGLLLFNLSTRKIVKRYAHDSNQPLSIGDNRIQHVRQDRNGTLWVGSNTLQQASSTLYNFTELVNNPEDILSCHDNDIYWMAPMPSGNILVSTATGSSILNTSDNTFQNPPLHQGHMPGPSYGVLGSEDGHAWIGQYEQLNKIDLQQKSIVKSYARDIVVDAQNNIFRRACRIMEDSQNKIWTIDHWGRLKYIDPINNQVSNVFELAQDSASGKFVNCLTFLDDPESKQIIVGTDLGFALVSYEAKKVTKLQIEHNGIDLSKANYSYLYRDLKNETWVIIDGKTYKVDIENSALELLDLSTSINIGSFRWIVEEPEHTYWLSSFKGILRYDENSKMTTNYFTSNVGGSTFSDPSPVVQSGGKIYFAGYKGISILDPASLNTRERKITPIISKILINQEAYPIEQPIDADYNLDLKYNENDISLWLTNFEFINQRNSKYQYRLSPGDSDWVQNGTDNMIKLFNLPPNNYTLEIKASNNIGQWSDATTALTIYIVPPWWETLWARTLALLIGLGIALQIQRSLYQKKLENQKKFDALRNKISNDLHDDVGSILTGVAMQSELLENYVSEKGQLLAHQVAQKSRDAITLMRDNVWAIDSRKDSIRDLKDRMLDFAEEVLGNAEIIIDLHCNSDLLDVILKPNVRQSTYLIFKESITNITKHSDTATVVAHLGIENKSLSLTIQDEGSRKTQTRHSGQGLESMKQRALSNKGTYSFLYQNGYKTSLIIPL